MKLDWIGYRRHHRRSQDGGRGGASPATSPNRWPISNITCRPLTIWSWDAAFVFVVVERELPFQIGVYQLDDDAIAEGRYFAAGSDLIANAGF